MFFDLTKKDISNLIIKKKNNYNCIIEDKQGNQYDGFKLAESSGGKAVTICEIDFQKSTRDQKYHPRLVFKRTDENLEAKEVPRGSATRRIPFHKGGDGYREFWEMISFLKSWDNFVYTGNFDKKYRVATSDEVIAYLNNQEAYNQIINELGPEPVSYIHSLSTIKLLKSYREKIKHFIKERVTETEVQEWIDENDKYKQSRCMIFGLEFIDHKREGYISGDRYDLLTKIGKGREEHILIELKSPSDNVFTTKIRQTKNNSKSEYALSNSISRAIPQILEYRKNLEDKKPGDPELEKVGINNSITISKCIIIVGYNKKDERWKKNFNELRKSLSSNLEIWTYTDLFYKIDSTINNLEKNKE
jgi:hypothetical protein